MDSNNSATASRRTVLQALAAAATLSVLPSGVQAMATPPRLDFLRASATLTGIELDRSYLQLASDIWTLLTLHGERPLQSLVELVLRVPERELPQRLRQLALEPQARRLLNVWYRGQIELAPADLTNPAVVRICGDLRRRIDPDHPQRPISAVINYDEALSWQACSFTKPAATCGGPFGYWAEPPVPAERVATTGKQV